MIKIPAFLNISKASYKAEKKAVSPSHLTTSFEFCIEFLKYTFFQMIYSKINRIKLNETWFFPLSLKVKIT